MKGVILAGGVGSRLYPLTKVTNKHLLPVGRYPMIFYPIAKLKEAGITEILIVTAKEHAGAIANLLGSGHQYSLKFTYRIQDRAEGIAQALGLAEDFVGDHRSVVILGDNIFEDSLRDYMDNFLRQREGAKVLLAEVPDPRRFGVAELKGDRIVSIEEKPENPKSSLVVTGIYMYDSSVFEIIKTLKPSSRGELEITDVNNAYLQREALTYDLLKGRWTDAGAFDTLAQAVEVTEKMVLDLE